MVEDIRIPAILGVDGDRYFASCEILGVKGRGDSREESIRNFYECAVLTSRYVLEFNDETDPRYFSSKKIVGAFERGLDLEQLFNFGDGI